MNSIDRTIKKSLIAILKKKRADPTQVEIEVRPSILSGYYKVLVVWDGFENMPEIERILWLSDALRKKLGKADGSVIQLVTRTRMEQVVAEELAHQPRPPFW